MSFGKMYYWGMSSAGVGHLALQLPNQTYISHWPQEGKGTGSGAALRPLPAKRQPNLQADIEDEGRAPDETSYTVYFVSRFCGPG